MIQTCIAADEEMPVTMYALPDILYAMYTLPDILYAMYTLQIYYILCIHFRYTIYYVYTSRYTHLICIYRLFLPFLRHGLTM